MRSTWWHILVMTAAGGGGIKCRYYRTVLVI